MSDNIMSGLNSSVVGFIKKLMSDEITFFTVFKSLKSSFLPLVVSFIVVLSFIVCNLMSFYSASNGKSIIYYGKSRCQTFLQKFLKLYFSLIFARVVNG